MPRLTILIDGEEIASRDVDSVDCEQRACGEVELHATFPPVDMSGAVATGTVVTTDGEFQWGTGTKVHIADA